MFLGNGVFDLAQETQMIPTHSTCRASSIKPRINFVLPVSRHSLPLPYEKKIKPVVSSQVLEKQSSEGERDFTSP